MTYLKGLTVDGLYDIATEHLAWNLDPEQTAEDFGEVWDDGGPAGIPLITPLLISTPWIAIKDEFAIFLCTKDKKYSSLRRNLSKSASATQLATVSTISAAVASSLGLVAASIVPVCAICLIAALKMGKEAFCKAQYLDVKVGPDRQKLATGPSPRRRA